MQIHDENNDMERFQSFVHGNIRLSTTSIVLDPQNAYFSINKRNVSAQNLETLEN